MYKIIKSLYIPENFYELMGNENNKIAPVILNIIQKLIALGFLEDTFIRTIQDFVYNTNFTYKPKDYYDDTQGLSIYDTIKKMNKDVNTSTISKFRNLLNILNNDNILSSFVKNFFELVIKNFTDFNGGLTVKSEILNTEYIVIWELYIYIREYTNKTRKIFFTNNKIVCDENYLKETYKHIKGDVFNSEYNRSLNNIYDTLKIKIEQYNDVVDMNINLNSRTTDPIFTKNYYNYLTFLNDLYKRDGYFFIESNGIINKDTKYEYHSYNEKQNDTIFVENILFFERIKLLFSIMSELMSFTSNMNDPDSVLFFKDIVKNIISQVINEFTESISIEVTDIIKYEEHIDTTKRIIALIIPLGAHIFFSKGDSFARNIYKFDTYNINQHRDYIYFLLENPEVLIDLEDTNINIFKSITERLNIIYYNIFYIFFNEKIKNNLICWCVDKIYTGLDIDDYVKLLVLLLYGYMDSDLTLNVMRPGYNTINNNCLILKKLVSKKNRKEFMDEINKCSGIEDRKMVIIKKHFPLAKLKKNSVEINEIEYDFMYKDANSLTNIFSRDDDICLIEKNKSWGSVQIYILGENIKILFQGEKKTYNTNINIKKTYNTNINIKKIYINDCEVIKYADIECPFKYFIPVCGPYFIYKVNNIYTITYFANDYKDKSILGISNVSNNITISINPNNLMFPEKMDSEKLMLFVNLCKNYGVTKYNYRYINDITNTPTDMSFLNTKTYMLYKQTDEKNTYIEKLVHADMVVKKINLFEESENAMVNYDENLGDIMLKFKDKLGTVEQDAKENLQKSIKKLLNKIKKCTINDSLKPKIIESLKEIIALSAETIKTFTENFKNFTFNFNEMISSKFYVNLYNYLSLLRVSNMCSEILNNIGMPNDILCSKIKIIYEKLSVKTKDYIYLFEPVFELLFGYEISDDQYSRYTDIIRKFDDGYDIKNKSYLPESMKVLTSKTINQFGGTVKKYPLHHFMMGKGKSSVITPLLTLYFTLVKNKKIYIVVPSHLIKQTNKTMAEYLEFFNIKKKVIIISDSDIKLKFLEGEFKDPITNMDTVILIDEFDSVLDPLKSNLNITEEKSISVKHIYKLLKHIIKELRKRKKLASIDWTPWLNEKFSPENIEVIKNGIMEELGTGGILENIDLTEFNENFTQEIIEKIKNDITNIIKQLESLELKENINWGIDPKLCYAVPYLNKDTPLLGSTFSSCVLTIFLTLYYYIVIRDYKIDKKLSNYVIENRLSHYIFGNGSKNNIGYDIFTKIIEDEPHKTEERFDKLFNNIMANIQLAEYQYNTSFVDIINIENVFKIGYSGTLNIELPQIENGFDEITEDYDEKINIKYAVLKSESVNFGGITTYVKESETLLEKFITLDNLKKYSALIDASGLFKNIENNVVAKKIHETLTRDVIFLDSEDNKKVYINNTIENYSESFTYTNPFLYYSQSHIIGIDIDQDKYPNILGLCIIDNKTLYTTVAQAVFRLRKLNIGHLINFYLLNIDTNNIDSSEKLYRMLKDNDRINMNNKRELLTYQTVKSITRKNLPVNNDFKQNYKEKIKYYYFEKTIENDVKNLLEGIIDYEMVKKISVFNRIDDKKILTKLIYNINTLSHDVSMQQEKLKNTQIETQNEIKFIKDEKSRYSSVSRINYVLNNNVLNNIEKFVDFISVKLTENVYCLINVFNESYPIYERVQYEMNPSFFIYLENKKTLLLIPKYMLIYVYNKYLVFNTDMTVVNNILYYKIELENNEMLNKFTNDNFIKLCSLKNEKINFEELISTPAAFIFYEMFWRKEIYTEIQIETITKLNEYTRTLDSMFKEKINSSLSNEHLLEKRNLIKVYRRYGGSRKTYYVKKITKYMNKIKNVK